MSWRIALALSAVLLAAPGCGDGDDDDDDTTGADAAAVVDAPPGAIDAAVTGGGLGDLCSPGAFDGGPATCQPDLECCADVFECREPDDCSSSGGFIPCDEGADCPSSKICCDTPEMRFCTKRSACEMYDGTEIP